eukprot:gnl/Trimastix_PCT/2478.p1 GENE.gnl/Trimastix_PCT/2478~~gnl/Trimastix_PCT/2478.p1  ORF type:complete len:656 (-),score=125.14 gnl/Trimastix_PCT/2478:269-2236(-)
MEHTTTLPDPPILRKLRESLVGITTTFPSPFGDRHLLYCDFAASGRGVSFIEDKIRNKVLPYYANTHTVASYCGKHTTQLREDARNIIRQAVNASVRDHAVIFCGAGVTGCVNKLVDVLNIRRNRYAQDSPTEEEIPLIFVGRYEHHSNLIPWRETIADVIEIGLEPETGELDLEELERMLQLYDYRTLKIGSFSAASNVTGMMTNVTEVTRLLHRHGAMACFDFACAGPYLPIDMGGETPNTDGSQYPTSLFDDLHHPDVVFLSPHKFVGGPQTPGILVAHKRIFTNRVPGHPGGGTVLYVTRKGHVFSKNIESREEGGTPHILGSIRAGLAFRLKQEISPEVIHAREEAFVIHALERWRAKNNIVLLGPQTHVNRLAIIAFLVHFECGGDCPCSNGTHNPPPTPHQPLCYLHHNLMVVLLNDLFGIQARSGCACAGPYGHHILGIPDCCADRLQAIVESGRDAHPGWARLSLHYHMSLEEVDYVTNAVLWIATHGWKVVPLYRFYARQGLWKYVGLSQHAPDSVDIPTRPPCPAQTPYGDLSEEAIRALLTRPFVTQAASLTEGDLAEESIAQDPVSLEEVAARRRWYLQQADALADYVVKHHEQFTLDPPQEDLGADFDRMRWFLLPQDVLAHLQGNQLRTWKPVFSFPHRQ